MLSQYVSSLFKSTVLGASSLVGLASIGYGAPISHTTSRVSVKSATMPDASAFAYVLHQQGQRHQTIRQYQVGKDGSLKLCPEGEIAAGSDANWISIDSVHRFAYVTGGPDDTLLQFRIKPDGTLTALSPPTVKTGPKAEYICLDADTGYAYSMGERSSALWRYKINPNGTLAPLSPIVVEDAINVCPRLCPHRDFLYVTYVKAEDATVAIASHPNINPPIYYDTYRIISDSEVQKVSSLRVPTGGNLMFDPTGRYAYIDTKNNTVQCYAIQSDGSLKSSGELQVSTGSRPGDAIGIVFDPKGQFAYLVHKDDQTHDHLSQYKISTDGVLTPLLPEEVPTDGDLVNISLDPTARFLYTTNIHTYTPKIDSFRRFICCYRIDTDGTLHRVGGRTETGDNADLPSFTPDGKFVYVQNDRWLPSNQESQEILGFRVRPDGTLTALSPSKYAVTGFNRDIQFVK